MRGLFPCASLSAKRCQVVRLRGAAVDADVIDQAGPGGGVTVLPQPICKFPLDAGKLGCVSLRPRPRPCASMYIDRFVPSQTKPTRCHRSSRT
jgi:hypothetical protein